MKKILVFTPHFYPENQILNDLVFSLNNKFKFIIITSFPNYPERKLFKDYKIWRSLISKKYQNVLIIRLPVIYRKGNNLFFLCLNYVSYVISSLLILPFLFLINYQRVFIFLTSPFTITIPAYILSFIKKKPISIWVLDLWPETLDLFDFPFKNFLKSIIFKYTQIFYSKCKNIFISSEGFSKSTSLINHKKKIFFIPQWNKQNQKKKNIDNILSDKFHDKDFIILFAGNMGKAQNLQNVFQSIYELKDYDNIKWIFLGNGSERKSLEEKIISNNLSNVFFYDHVPVEETYYFYNIASANLISLVDNPAINYVLPAKLQHCLGYGKPILTLANGEVSYFVKNNNIGLAADSEDYISLSKNVLNLINYKEKELMEINKKSKILIENLFKKESIINKIKSLAFE